MKNKKHENEKSMQFYVPEMLFRRIKSEAALNGVSVATYIIAAIVEKYMAENKTK